MEHATDTNVYTNLATGESVTEVESRNENMLRVTNNGDGTLTFLEQGAYPGTLRAAQRRRDCAGHGQGEPPTRAGASCLVHRTNRREVVSPPCARGSLPCGQKATGFGVVTSTRARLAQSRA